MTPCVLLRHCLFMFSCLYLVGCGEEQFRVGASMGGTSQQPSFGGGGLPISPLPSLDDVLDYQPRYVVWAPEANTQECEGLDISVHVVNQSDQKILPAGYATDLIAQELTDAHNLHVEVHVKNISSHVIQQGNVCTVAWSNSKNQDLNTLPDLDCQMSAKQYLPDQVQILNLHYQFPYQATTWEMDYKTDFIVNGQVKHCHIQAIPFVVEEM